MPLLRRCADKDTEKRQRLAIERFAKGRFEIIAWFNDPAVSGADPIEARPGFSALLDRIGLCVVGRSGPPGSSGTQIAFRLRLCGRSERAAQSEGAEAQAAPIPSAILVLGGAWRWG
jgi:hypothetical protein